jgi:HAD superfamily hydrolase (TIGR01490 family)
LQPLSRFPRAELDTWQREFLSRHIVPLIGAKARALVREHLDGGALCAIVTATNSFVTGPIVREFGIAHLIATIPAQDNGQFTGQPRGIPSFREGKIVRVEAWLEAMGLWWSSFERSWFYSDSQNDLPLLSRVSHPVVVDPRPYPARPRHRCRLADPESARVSALAITCHWPVEYPLSCPPQ